MAILRVVPVDYRPALRATDTALRTRLSIWDILIIEVAATAGGGRPITEDLGDGQTIRDVQTLNPSLPLGEFHTTYFPICYPY